MSYHISKVISDADCTSVGEEGGRLVWCLENETCLNNK